VEIEQGHGDGQRNKVDLFKKIGRSKEGVAAGQHILRFPDTSELFMLVD